jgi:arabinofuranosyltransferase
MKLLNSLKSESLSSRDIYLATAAICILFLVLAIYHSFVCDDAFISFRYAKNIAQGLGPVFNPGERVEGYTNFLWTLLLAAIFKAGGSLVLWSRILSIIFSLATITTFIFWIRQDRKNSLLMYLFPAFLVFSTPFFVWSTGGLETAFYTYLVFNAIIVLFYAIDQKSKIGLLFSSLLFVATVLTRPDGILFWSLSSVFIVILLIRQKLNFKSLLSFIIPFIIIYGSYYYWRFDYYGKLFPNTFYIKVSSFWLYSYGFRYFLLFLIKSSLWIPLALMIFYFSFFKLIFKTSQTAFLILTIVTYIVYIISIGGDFMDLSRFFMPILPLIFLLFYMIQSNRDRFKYTGKIIFIMVMSLVLFAGLNLYIAHQSRKPAYFWEIDSIGSLEDYSNKWSSVARVLRESGAPGDSVAITAAGIIPYYTGMYTIDCLGLIAPDLTKYDKRGNVNRPGHSRWIKYDYLYSLRPQFIIYHPRITEGQHPEKLLDNISGDNDPILKYYYPACVELPEYKGTFLNFWIRKDVYGRIQHKIYIYEFK